MSTVSEAHLEGCSKAGHAATAQEVNAKYAGDFLCGAEVPAMAVRLRVDRLLKVLLVQAAYIPATTLHIDSEHMLGVHSGS
jgi:hypothetical protein